jgi:hypothetical protein
MNLNSKRSHVSGSKILRSTANNVAYTVPSLRSCYKYCIQGNELTLRPTPIIIGWLQLPIQYMKKKEAMTLARGGGEIKST